MVQVLNDPNSKFPHSCCGDCGRVCVSWNAVPANFNGCASREDQTSVSGPLIGIGWVRGSFWEMLRFGWWYTSRIRKDRIKQGTLTDFKGKVEGKLD
jgi:hypothetical protein